MGRHPCKLGRRRQNTRQVREERHACMGRGRLTPRNPNARLIHVPPDLQFSVAGLDPCLWEGGTCKHLAMYQRP